MKSFLELLNAQQTSILSAASIIASTLFISKILGLIRDRLLAHLFSPDQFEIFFAAFRLPDLIFQILILGALSVAFIPVFIEYLEDQGKSEAFEMARSVLNISLLVFIVTAVLVYVLASPITSWLIVPGFTPDRQLQVVALTRIILIGQIILAIGSFFIGILQSFRRFIIPAFAAVFYNLGIILGIVFLHSSMGIKGAAWGVVLGALLHGLIQLPLIWSLGFRFKWPNKFLHPGVKEIIRIMSMRTLGLAAEQINETVGLALASLVSVGSVGFLTFAQHLQVVPIGLFGATLAQAALPVLSSERARGRMEEFKITLLTTMHQILFLALPATAILIVIRVPVVRLVFGASQFNWPATVLTAQTLAFLAIGLAAQAISLLLVRGFYALKDTRTPVLVSLTVVILNITLSVYFITILRLEVWGIGLANSISAIVSAVLLFWALHFKVGKFNLNQVLIPLAKMLIATIIMGLALYIPIKLLDQVIFDTTRTINLIILTLIASSFACLVYVLLVWMLRVKELNTYADLVKRIGSLQTTIKSEELIHDVES